MLSGKYKYMIWNCVKYTQSFFDIKSALYAGRGFAATQGRTERSITL